MKKPWIKSRLKKPEQGKKVLCFNKGDVDIRYRFKNVWAPVPYTDSMFANFNEPQFWQEIDFPEGYTGHLRVQHEGKMRTLDELEEIYPEFYEEVIGEFLKAWGQKK